MSWALLLLSLAAGIGHLRSKVLTLAAGHQRHTLMQDLSAKIRLQEAGGTAEEIATGELLQGETLAAYIDQLRSEKHVLDNRVEQYQKRSRYLGTFRNYWLVSGVAIYAAWRCVSLLK